MKKMEEKDMKNKEKKQYIETRRYLKNELDKSHDPDNIICACLHALYDSIGINELTIHFLALLKQDIDLEKTDKQEID